MMASRLAPPLALVLDLLVLFLGLILLLRLLLGFLFDRFLFRREEL